MATKEEQVKEIAHIITSEQCSKLPHSFELAGQFTVRGGLPYKVIKVIAEQIYKQGYRKK